MKRTINYLVIAASLSILTSLATAQDRKVPFALPTPNDPKGIPQGINPGRVAWAHYPKTAQWNEATDAFWFDDKWNSQANCDRLVASTITSLTGESSEAAAWKALFIHFNDRHGKGKNPYRKGEKVAIKINMNNTYSHDDSEEINASPHLVLSLLRSLVNKGGVPQENIALIEPSRHLTNFLYNKCAAEFPNVIYVDNNGGDGRTKSTYTENAITYSSDNGSLSAALATHVLESDYNINMALLKGHGGQGVTLCGKNWYGVTGIHANWRMNHHDGMNQRRDGRPSYITFVDYMGHKELGGKTLIYFIDGLYGSKIVDKRPSGKWRTAPFNNDWPNTLLASQDGVAIDAVAIDILTNEFPDMADVNYCDMYLLEAATADAPASGTKYDPEHDGVLLKSLGVVEHWNNPKDRNYSRNLGKKNGIELIYKCLK